MNCPKCGVENPSDAVFCSACGERIDGKKHCIKCGKLIDEKNVYCNYCGTRQDGKTVCPKCKTAYEGSFCPNCGVKSSPVGQPCREKGAFRHSKFPDFFRDRADVRFQLSDRHGLLRQSRRRDDQRKRKRF